MKEELSPITALIVDADPTATPDLESWIESQQGFAVTAIAVSGMEAIAEIGKQHPDVMFLAIDLPDMQGFDVVRQISPAIRPLIVFLSAHPEDAVRAFEYSACDYLLKPYSRERLHLTLIKVRDLLYQKGNNQLHEKLNALFRYINPTRNNLDALSNRSPQLIPVKMSGRIYFLHPDNIEFIEAAGYYIEVFAHGKKHLIRQSLTQLDALLDSSKFVRIHRSVMINLNYLKEIIRDGANDFSVRMQNEAVFRISRSYKPDVFGKVGL